MSKTPALADFRRIVVKVGSSLLVDSGAGKLKETWLASLADRHRQLYKEKRDVLVVSSGRDRALAARCSNCQRAHLLEDSRQ